jgi:hypothetical protein
MFASIACIPPKMTAPIAQNCSKLFKIVLKKQKDLKK